MIGAFALFVSAIKLFEKMLDETFTNPGQPNDAIATAGFKIAAVRPHYLLKLLRSRSIDRLQEKRIRKSEKNMSDTHKLEAKKSKNNIRIKN